MKDSLKVKCMKIKEGVEKRQRKKMVKIINRINREQNRAKNNFDLIRSPDIL